MTQEEKSRAVLLAEEKVGQAKAGLAKAKREERKKHEKSKIITSSL